VRIFAEICHSAWGVLLRHDGTTGVTEVRLKRIDGTTGVTEVRLKRIDVWELADNSVNRYTLQCLLKIPDCYMFRRLVLSGLQAAQILYVTSCPV
jgi:hypothetical protein